MIDKFYSKPEDESLQACKAWIIGVLRRIIPDEKDIMTEEEWVNSWRKFWSKA